jgi:hypothetical protein
MLYSSWVYRQDELSYIAPLDSDDFLVGPNATARFNAKSEIEQFFDRHPGCGSMKLTWLEVQPDEKDWQSNGWELQSRAESIAERLRIRPVHTKRSEPKSVLNTAAVLSTDCHYSEMLPGYKRCKAPLWALHAREAKLDYDFSKQVRFGAEQSKRAFEWARAKESYK